MIKIVNISGGKPRLVEVEAKPVRLRLPVWARGYKFAVHNSINTNEVGRYRMSEVSSGATLPGSCAVTPKLSAAGGRDSLEKAGERAFLEAYAGAMKVRSKL